jgi:hypothetical protein
MFKAFINNDEGTRLISISDRLVDILAKEDLSYRDAVTVLEITQDRLQDTQIGRFGKRTMQLLTRATD